MTMSLTASRRTAALRRAAVRATYAPSVHNTQPWRLELRGDELALHADRERQLTVLDPSGRQLMISIGCALLNARVALAGAGIVPEVSRFPDPHQPDLVARLRIGKPARVADDTDYADDIDDPDGTRNAAGGDPELAALDHVLELRQTNRRHFADDDVPADLLARLEAAVAAESALLYVVHDADHRVIVASLSQHADDVENLNPAYRAELRAWTTDDPQRRDGVRDLAVPHVDGSAQDEVPIRDFDSRGTGYLPGDTRSSRKQCLVLVCSPSDTPMQWLRTGEALERMLLEVTRHGFAASPLTQVTEVPSARAQLRRELGLIAYPSVLVRIGRAPATPSSPRRRLVDVLFEE